MAYHLPELVNSSLSFGQKNGLIRYIIFESLPLFPPYRIFIIYAGCPLTNWHCLPRGHIFALKGELCESNYILYLLKGMSKKWDLWTGKILAKIK
jgi:hypothetical protein